MMGNNHRHRGACRVRGTSLVSCVSHNRIRTHCPRKLLGGDVLLRARRRVFYTEYICVRQFGDVSSILYFLLLRVTGSSSAMQTSVVQKIKRGRFYNPSPTIIAVLVPVFALMVYWVDVRPALGAYHTVAALQIPDNVCG